MSALHVTQYHPGTGSGTLVLLHGFPVDHRMWDATASLVDASWKVLGVDLPGLGLSGFPQGTPSMAAAAHAVSSSLKAFGEISRPLVLAGLSMGGYVVQAALREFPQDIDAVVLLDTRANPDTAEAAANRLKIADESAASGTSASVIGMASSTLSASNVAEKPELVNYMRELIAEQSGSGIAWSQQAMATRPSSFETLQNLAVPALLIVGADDTVSPVDVMQEMADLIDDSTLVVVPDAGHMTPVEQPAHVADAINNFLSRLGS